MIVTTIPGMLYPLITSWTTEIGSLKQFNFGSAIAHLPGCFCLCSWLSLYCLMPWINHSPPVCWSTFVEISFKRQLVCKNTTEWHEVYKLSNMIHGAIKHLNYPKPSPLNLTAKSLSANTKRCLSKLPHTYTNNNPNNDSLYTCLYHLIKKRTKYLIYI